jgi:hypothetical protein
MDLIRRINKKAVVALIVCAALSAFVEWKKLPVSIIIGGILGLANIKGLSWSVEGLMGTYRATGKMIFFSIFRLVILCVIISLLVYLKLVNIFGILIGFTVIFTLLITEGLKYAEKIRAGDKS